VKARVALVTTNLARGGAEGQVALLARGLRRQGWDLSVISLLKPSAFEAELSAAGVPVFSLHMRPGGWNPPGYPRFAFTLRKLRPQILHSHMFHANLLARAARLVCPVPVLISTLHSLAESGRKSGQVRCRDWSYRLTDPLSDLTVAVSGAVAARHASARAVSTGRIRVIPNAVDTTLFRPDAGRRAHMRQLLGLGPEFAWLAVGRLMWKKGYDTMLRAFAGLGRGVLLVAGAGPQEGKLRRLAEDVGAHVRFLGEREDVSDLMSACDGFVNASLVEGLPVALLEAASSGLPAVASDTGGVGEIVLHEKTGYLIPPDAPDALAAAMSRLMSLSAEERRKLSLAAREHAAAKFDTGVVLKQWEELYRELLSRWT
jgi:glycosyltransferase involved in cell wall biosynthesis